MTQRIDPSKVFLIAAIYFLLFLCALVGMTIEFVQKGNVEPLLLTIPVGALCIALIYGWFGINLQNYTKEEIGTLYFKIYRIAVYASIGALLIPMLLIVGVIVLITTKVLEPRLPVYLEIMSTVTYIGGGLVILSILLLYLLYRHQKHGGIEVNRSLKEIDGFISKIKSLKTVFIAFRGEDNSQALGLIDGSLLVWSTAVYAENMLYYTNIPELNPKNSPIHIHEVPIEEVTNKAEVIGYTNILFDYIRPNYPHHKLTVDEFRGYIS